jgi:hypothetical protein
MKLTIDWPVLVFSLLFIVPGIILLLIFSSWQIALGVFLVAFGCGVSR